MYRRDVLRLMGNGFGMLALADSLRAAGQGPLAVKPPHFAPSAKRVIFLFMNGGIVAGRHVRSQAGARQASWRADAGAEDQDRPRLRQPHAVALCVPQMRPERHSK